MVASKRKTVFVAMSGGVDSSVSALLLKQMGFDVVGVTMLLYNPNKGAGRSCCSVYDISDAEAVARKIKIPFYVMDMREEFKKFVIDNFISEYLNARTPSPCVHCNNFIKFDLFLKKAEKIGADYIATGHYAVKLIEGTDFVVGVAKDKKKDQSYFLFGLTSEQLKKIIFPVGNMTKSLVRKMASEYELPTAVKPDSQDLCFTEGKDWKEIIRACVGKEKPGYIVDEKGKIIGKHAGYFFFTVGQRRGLEIKLRAGTPLYVTEVDKDKNLIKVGDKESLIIYEFVVKDVIFPSDIIREKFRKGIKVVARVRYTHSGTPAFVRLMENGEVYVKFEEGYGPVVPGQACVFYSGQSVLGGGFISYTFPRRSINPQYDDQKL